METEQQERMIMKNLQLYNFKSYYDKHIIGPFNKKFSTIIGPNGSGKSNLIDAMLFVFGKRANKMRLQKLNELIHNSSQHQNCQEAYVQVEFCKINTTQELNEVSNSNIFIKRTINQNNDSNYYINDKKSTYKLVTEFLKSNQIDLEKNRFIILQGEVEQISQMKPISHKKDNPGFLEYLEDIIGTDQYIEKIEEYEQELDQIELNKTSKAIQVKGLQKDLQGLEKYRNQALEYLKFEKQIFQQKNLLIQLKKFNFKIQKDKRKEQLKVVYNHTQELEQEIKLKKENNKDVVDKIKILKEQENEKSKQKYQLEEQFDKLKLDFDSCKRNLIGLKKDMETCNINLQNNQNEINKCSNNQGELKKEFIQQNILLEELKSQQEKLQVFMDKFYLQYKDQINQYEIQISNLKKQKLELQEQQENYEQDLNQFVQNKDQVEIKYSDLKGKIEENKLILYENSQEHQQCQLIINQNEKQKDDFFNELNQKKTIYQQLQQQHDKNNYELQNLYKSLDNVKQNYQGQYWQNRIYDQLIEAQKQGKLTGIYDYLGKMAEIDVRYYKPVFLAGGSMLKTIVVEKILDAQKAISYLRNNRIGSANFIALEKVRKYHKEEMQFKTPEGIIRIFDILKIKNNQEKIKNLFYQTFRNSLITQDVKTSWKIYKMYGNKLNGKIVTYRGEIINEAGLFSQKRSDYPQNVINIINQKQQYDQKDQEDLKQQIYQKKQIQEQQQEQLNLLNTDIDNVNVQYYRLKNIYDKNLQRLQQLISQGKSLKSQQIDLKDQLQIVEKNKNQLLNDKAVENLKKDLKKIIKNINNIDQEIKIQNSNKFSLGTNEQKEKLENYENMKEKVEQQIDKVNQIQAQQTFHQNQEQTLQQEKQELEIQIEQCKQDQIEQNDQHQKYIQIAQDNKNQQHQLDQILEQIQEQKKQIIRDQEQFKTEFDLLLNKKYKLDNEINHIKNEINDFDIQKKEQKQNQLLLKKKYDEQLKDYQFLEEDNILQEEQSQLQIKEEDLQTQSKQRIKLIDWQLVYKVSVCQKYPIEILQKFQNLTKQLQQKIDIDSDKQSTSETNLNKLIEYKEKNSKFLKEQKELDIIKEKEQKIKQNYIELKERRKNEFMIGFDFISNKMKEIYSELTNGGDVELEIMDSSNPFSKGAKISVKPRKTWSIITLLSGGQKTIVSLSFIYSLHEYKPNSIYFMDEIDAALDFKNRTTVANFIKKRSQTCQFIVISLNNEVAKKSQTLIGIYKINNISFSTTLEIDKLKKNLQFEDEDENQFVFKIYIYINQSIFWSVFI